MSGSLAFWVTGVAAFCIGAVTGMFLGYLAVRRRTDRNVRGT